jgi:hypothetical protein
MPGKYSTWFKHSERQSLRQSELSWVSLRLKSAGGRFATFGKIAWIAVAKYGASLPIRNLQTLDGSAIGNTERLPPELPSRTP